MRRKNVKIISLYICLVFLQNLGLQLFVHEALHESKIKERSGEFSYKISCSCLDDSFTPISSTPLCEVPKPHESVVTIFIESSEKFVSLQKEFTSLRGPPAC